MSQWSYCNFLDTTSEGYCFHQYSRKISGRLPHITFNLSSAFSTDENNRLDLQFYIFCTFTRERPTKCSKRYYHAFSNQDSIFPHTTPLSYYLCSNRTLEGEPTCTASLGGIGARNTCYWSILCTFHGKQRNTGFGSFLGPLGSDSTISIVIVVDLSGYLSFMKAHSYVNSILEILGWVIVVYSLKSVGGKREDKVVCMVVIYFFYNKKISFLGLPL